MTGTIYQLAIGSKKCMHQMRISVFQQAPSAQNIRSGGRICRKLHHLFGFMLITHPQEIAEFSQPTIFNHPHEFGLKVFSLSPILFATPSNPIRSVVPRELTRMKICDALRLVVVDGVLPLASSKP